MTSPRLANFLKSNSLQSKVSVKGVSQQLLQKVPPRVTERKVLLLMREGWKARFCREQSQLRVFNADKDEALDVPVKWIQGLFDAGVLLRFGAPNADTTYAIPSKDFDEYCSRYLV